MAINVKGGQANVVVAKVDVPFINIGISPANTNNIFLVDFALRSFDPRRTLNPITAFQQGKGYYINALEDMDLTQWVGPPFATGKAITTEDNDEIIPES